MPNFTGVHKHHVGAHCSLHYLVVLGVCGGGSSVCIYICTCVRMCVRNIHTYICIYNLLTFSVYT